MGIAVLDRRGHLVDADAGVRAALTRSPELARVLSQAAQSESHRSGWTEHAARLPDRTLRIRMLVNANQGEVVAFVAEAERPFLLDPARLSPRERDVTRLIGAGASDAQVARRLRIAVATVRWHLTNIYRKTRLRGRAALEAAAAELEREGAPLVEAARR